jgi:hypothetical protein
MNRRYFLTAGCIGTIMGAPLAMPAQPQSDPPFKMIEIDVSGNKIFCRSNQPDVALSGAEAGSKSQRGVRRPARLWPRRHTSCRQGPLRLFEARDGK